MRVNLFVGSLVVGMFSVRRVAAFAPRALTGVPRRAALVGASSSTTTQRWMSSDVNEKTEEEKEAQKAIREERK
jgi:hypothetical protein